MSEQYRYLHDVDRFVEESRREDDPAADAIDQLFNSDKYDAYALQGKRTEDDYFLAFGLVCVRDSDFYERRFRVTDGSKRFKEYFQETSRIVGKLRTNNRFLGSYQGPAIDRARSEGIKVLAAVEITGREGSLIKTVQLLAPKFYRLMVGDYTHEFSRGLSAFFLKSILFRR